MTPRACIVRKACVSCIVLTYYLRLINYQV